MEKYYAVYRGKHPGIYGTWDEAKKQVDGYSKATYKSFKAYEDATLWLKKNGAKKIKSYIPVKPEDSEESEDPYSTNVILDNKPDTKPDNKYYWPGTEDVTSLYSTVSQDNAVDSTVRLYTDGSYDSRTQTYSWAYALVYNSHLMISHSGKQKAGADNMWQISGEIEAVLQGLNACSILELGDVTVYYDLANLQRWADHQWRANRKATIAYQDKVAQYRYSGMQVTFKKVKAHKGIRFNELVDYLAKKELGIKKVDNLDAIEDLILAAENKA